MRTSQRCDPHLSDSVILVTDDVSSNGAHCMLTSPWGVGDRHQPDFRYQTDPCVDWPRLLHRDQLRNQPCDCPGPFALHYISHAPILSYTQLDAWPPAAAMHGGSLHRQHEH
ncbi:hypothetical protein HaLaN_23234 [Haematococcus lacustris]|uniref:Uncharacterized protein n=1 Tax=Haematococcus lacustris TaxID=44745 RepID=A0A699ZTM7_HAELA|nr:hypothetical protein HaLaN_23234 [Haematococcus lacustris]